MTERQKHRILSYVCAIGSGFAYSQEHWVTFWVGLVFMVVNAFLSTTDWGSGR